MTPVGKVKPKVINYTQINPIKDNSYRFMNGYNGWSYQPGITISTLLLNEQAIQKDRYYNFLKIKWSRLHQGIHYSQCRLGHLDQKLKRVNKNKAPFSPRDLFLKTPSFVKRNTKVGAPRPEKCKIEKPQVLYFLFQILGQPPLLYFTFTKLGANQYA